jgi:uncharacterized Fe-S cluster protein YjdI
MYTWSILEISLCEYAEACIRGVYWRQVFASMPKRVYVEYTGDSLCEYAEACIRGVYWRQVFASMPKRVYVEYTGDRSLRVCRSVNTWSILEIGLCEYAEACIRGVYWRQIFASMPKRVYVAYTGDMDLGYVFSSVPECVPEV